MKSIAEYLNENIRHMFESDSLQTMLVSYDDPQGTNVVSWLEECGLLKGDRIILGKNGFITLEQLRELYIYAERSQKPCPMIGNYHGNKGDFVFRRWVGLGESVNILCDVVDLSKPGGKYKGLHNTNMKEDGKWFPSAEDMESVISYAWNKQNNFFESDSENILYVTQKDPVKDSKAEQLMAYYAGNTESINSIIAVIPKMVGKLRKLPSESPTTKEWEIAGEYDKRPDITPKTDIISGNGIKISLKKAGGSQLMSGFEKESRATLISVAERFGDESIKKSVLSLFEKPWKSRLTKDDTKEREEGKEQNRKLTDIVKRLFENQAFKKAVLMEAATGRIKFGEKSDSAADYILVWDDVKAPNNAWYKIEDYVDHCMPGANPIIAYKTAGKTSTSLRILTK